MRTLLRSVGTAAGLDRIGFASVAPFEDVEADIRRRKDEGLSNRLAFTYADPKGATDLRRHFPWAESLVVAARSYKPSAQTGDRGGRVAAAARWPGYAPLREALAAIQKVLVDQGHQAEVLCDDNRLVDRAAAVRAGIGWWGKNTMVLAPGLGTVVPAGFGRNQSADRSRPADGARMRQLFGLSAACPDRGPRRTRHP